MDGDAVNSCITIKNTIEYFRLENCTTYNAGGNPKAGIHLYNASNGIIIDCNSSYNTYAGILLEEQC